MFRNAASCENGENAIHRIERSYGSFVRTFSLPDVIDEEKVKADFKDGVNSDGDSTAILRDGSEEHGSLGEGWNPEIFADFLREDVDDLSMARNGGPLIENGIMPPGVPRSFSQLHASMMVQVAEQLLSLHIAMGSS